jgi:hypothetical protein
LNTLLSLVEVRAEKIMVAVVEQVVLGQHLA